MQVAGTADFSGYREVNPEADLGFIAWPGPEAGKYSTNTGMELLYTVSRFATPEAQEAATKLVDLAGDAGGAADGLRPDRPAGAHRSHRLERPDPSGDGAARGQDVIVWYDLPETNKTTDAAAADRAGRALDRPADRAAVRRGDAGRRSCPPREPLRRPRSTSIDGGPAGRTNRRRTTDGARETGPRFHLRPRPTRGRPRRAARRTSRGSAFRTSGFCCRRWSGTAPSSSTRRSAPSISACSTGPESARSAISSACGISANCCAATASGVRRSIRGSSFCSSSSSRTPCRSVWR